MFSSPSAPTGTAPCGPTSASRPSTTTTAACSASSSIPSSAPSGHNFVYALYTYDAPPGATAPVWKDKCKKPPRHTTSTGVSSPGNLVRIPVNPDGTAGKAKVLIKTEWCQQFTSHSVGHLAFGPDGYPLRERGRRARATSTADWGQLGGTLPATPTPANLCGDPPGASAHRSPVPTARGGSLRAQSPRRPAGEPVLLNGTVLRVNPKTGAGVAGNPMYNSADKKSNASRIVAYGFRNPFRFTFRPGTSEIWVGDVGEGKWEEINRVPSATTKPTPNFGWPCYEGAAMHNTFDALNLCIVLSADAAAPATDAVRRVQPRGQARRGRHVRHRGRFVGDQRRSRSRHELELPGSIRRRAVLRGPLEKLHLGRVPGPVGGLPARSTCRRSSTTPRRPLRSTSRPIRRRATSST